MLCLKINRHQNKGLQNDWKIFGKNRFETIGLAYGHVWAGKSVRMRYEKRLIAFRRKKNTPFCYNRLGVKRIGEIFDFKLRLQKQTRFIKLALQDYAGKKRLSLY